MAKETLYFSHDCNARNDRKLVSLRMQHGMQGVGVYWCIVEMLYEEGGYLPLEYERITFELRIEENVLRDVINAHGLFVVDGERFHSPAVLERLAVRMEKSEKARKSICCRWQKNGDTNVIRSNAKRNTKKEKEKEKEKEKNNTSFLPKEQNVPAKNGFIISGKRSVVNASSAGEDFELFWKAYPKPDGKAEAEKAFIKATDKPEISELVRIVGLAKEKYMEENKLRFGEIKWKFMKNASVWLNQKVWMDFSDTKVDVERLDLIDRYYQKKKLKMEDKGGTDRVHPKQGNTIQDAVGATSF